MASLEKSLAVARLEHEFEEAVATFEKRLKVFGVEVQDKNALKDALTHGGYRVEFENLSPADAKRMGINTALEDEGDKILNRIIPARIARSELSNLHNYLVSNVVFSRIALKIGMNDVIRVGKRMQSEHPEIKIRMLANAFEALAAAIYRNTNGEEDLKRFLENSLFSDIFVKDILPRMVGVSRDETTAALHVLTEGRARLDVVRSGKRFRAGIQIAGENYMSGRTPQIQIAIREVVLTFFKYQPWYVWGYEGAASIRYPLGSSLNREKSAFEEKQNE